MSNSYELRQALVTLYNADSQVQTLTGRTSNNLITRSRLATATLLVATYHIAFEVDAGGTPRKRVMVQIDGWGDSQQGHTPANIETLLDRAEALFTTNNLIAQSPSVDAAVYVERRRENYPQADGVFGAGLDFTFEIT
jgi:hypothetical protein